MAKGKHAAALFEVIHTGKNPPKSSLTGGIATPRWWFKGRGKSESTVHPASEPAEPTVKIVERIVERPVYIERPAPMRIASENALVVDKESGEINFKLSYAGAAAAGFILLIVLAIAYLVGSRSSQVSQSEDFHLAPGAAPSQPAAPADTLLAAAMPEAAPTPATPVEPITTIKPTADANGATISPTGSATPDKPKRQVGLNYVIVQSYPDDAVSQRAADFLNKNGIPCTVVKLPAYSMTSVVSLKGFDHVQHNPEMDDYRQKIETLGETFAGRRLFDRFHTQMIKWRKDQDQ